MGVVGRLDQYASMLTNEFDDYSMSENLLTNSSSTASWVSGTFTTETTNRILGLHTVRITDLSTDGDAPNLSGTSISPGTYTVSHYIDTVNSTSTSVLLYIFTFHALNGGFTFSNANSTFTLSTKTFSPIGYSGPAWSNASVSAVNIGNGIYRISITATTSLAGTSIRAYLSSGPSDTSYLLVAGSQYESGSTATDYTPTTGTAITRVLPSTTNTSITGLGTYYSSGFDENVGFTTFLSANILPPYDPVYDEFGGTLFGAGQGRYMRQNTDKSVIVYNEIDEITDFRDIVRTGLILDLDAGMNASFNNTGTTWNDLSGYGKNATAQNGVGYITSNGGGLTFDGTDDHFIISQRETSSQFTYEAFLMPTNVSKDQMYAGTTSDGFYLRITGSKAFLSISASGQRTLTHDTTLQNNQVYHIVSIYNGVQLKIYVNNILTSGIVINATMTGWGADRIGRWRDADQRSFVGNIYCLRAYNRELSAAEVLQNYNALRHRFGL